MMITEIGKFCAVKYLFMPLLLLSIPAGAQIVLVRPAETNFNPTVLAPKVTLSQSINALPQTDLSVINTIFITFKPHKENASRINLNPASEDLKTIKTPMVLSKAIQQEFHPENGQIILTARRRAFLDQASLEQWWSALEGLENIRDYSAAARLAQALMERTTSTQQKDLLALIAARNAMIELSPNAPQYKNLIVKAMNSSTSEVSASARLWMEAISGPRSAEALVLSNQIWETEWNDRGDLAGGEFMAGLMAKFGPAVFEKEKEREREPIEKGRLLGRLNSIISRAAYQANKIPVLEWTLVNANTLANFDPEDRVFPQYVKAVYINSRNDYAGALSEYQKVFFSGIVCDTSAYAGFCMAKCYDQIGDKIGAIATLEIMNKLYSTQKFVMPQAYHKLESLRSVVEDSSNLVTQYIEKHFKPQYEKALAEKSKSTLIREVAQLEK